MRGYTCLSASELDGAMSGVQNACLASPHQHEQTSKSGYRFRLRSIF